MPLDEVVADAPRSRARAASAEFAAARSERIAPTRRVSWAGLALLGIQFVAMAAFNALQYERFSETNDFGGYVQAWRAIAGGRLDPWVSIFQVRFLSNNLDLAMYPLALVHHLVASPVVLAWAQSAAVVATESVALLWARDVLEVQLAPRPRAAAVLLACTAVLLAANPWSWETIAFPVHFEAFAAFFAVLAARDLFRGRRRSLLVWVPLALGAEALGGAYVLAVGLGGILAGRSTRRAGCVLSAVGLGALALVVHFGAVGRNQATLLSTYGYLVPGMRGHVSLLRLVLGVAGHPSAVASVLASHAVYLLGYAAAGGLLGVLSPWGASAALVVLVPNALSSQIEFIDFPAAFQSWPAEPFIVVGTVLVVARALRRAGTADRVAARAIRLAGGVFLLQALLLAGMVLPRIPRGWLLDERTAAALELVAQRLPAHAEVIAEQGIIGRFAAGNAVFAIHSTGQRFPVDRARVVFILVPGLERRDEPIARYLGGRLRAVRFVERSGVSAFLWHPGARRTAVVLHR